MGVFFRNKYLYYGHKTAGSGKKGKRSMKFKAMLRHMKANHEKALQPRKRAVATALAKSKINKEN